mmetsp:Transcript_20988/g.51285  ORF Transcript_20988/g.51285 Transcript_20988/m.51285 type:complete len:208 (-) Transcript_20988:671-1294(-)
MEAPGGPQLDLTRLKKLQRTFLCVGPVCLRSGVGFGLGVGCGAGIGAGWTPFVVQTSAGGSSAGVGGFQLPAQVMQGLPGGYMVLDLLKKVMRNFPGSKTGAGCGFGVGYGFGVGLQYGGGAGAMPGMGASGLSSRTVSGVPAPDSQPAAEERPSVPAPPKPDPATHGRLDRFERRLERIEESLALYNRVAELERKVDALGQTRGRR